METFKDIIAYIIVLGGIYAMIHLYLLAIGGK